MSHGATQRPLRVVLTGGIASGKSTVAQLFATRGVPVIDTDVIAREVVEPGTPGLAAVVDAFGPDMLGADGRLDRASPTPARSPSPPHRNSAYRSSTSIASRSTSTRSS